MKNPCLICVFYLFVLFSFFPYVELLSLGVDNQPNALILSLILFPLWFKRKINVDIMCLFMLFLSSIIVFFIFYMRTHSIYTLKSIIQYLSLFVISFVTFEGLKRFHGFPYILYALSILVWFACGTLQYYVDPLFGSSLLFRSSGVFQGGRGITSLATEPTYYGYICLFFIIIGYLNFSKKKSFNFLLLLLVFQLFFYSRSFTSFLVLMTSFVFTFFIAFVIRDKNRSKYALFMSLFALFALMAYFFSFYLSGSRFGYLIQLFLDDPFEFLLLDSSANVRFTNIFFSIYAFFKDLFLPHGYNYFGSYIDELLIDKPCFGAFFNAYTYQLKFNYVQSGIGNIFFELGLFSLLYINVYIRSFKRIISFDNSLLFFLVLYVILMFNSVSFGNSMASFILGNIIYVAHKKHNQVKCVLLK